MDILNSPESVGILVSIVAGIFVLFLSRRMQKKRIEALSDYAANKGFDFRAEPLSDVSRFNQFTAFAIISPFGRKHQTSSAAKNTITGDWMIAGQAYELQSGYFRVHHKTDYCPYVLLRLPFGETPKLIIVEEEIHHKLMRDIEFTGGGISQEFNKRFFVRCPKENVARAVIQSDVMKLLLSKSRVNWLEMDQDTICLYHVPFGCKEKTAHIRGIEPFIDLMRFMEELVTVLPERFTDGRLR